MKIEVFNGVATLTTEIPVFVGTTGKGKPGATNFPILGTPLKTFMFSPEKNDEGTMVFDRPGKNDRTPTSSTFCQYWWEKGKLVVREGLSFERLQTGYSRHAVSGFSCTISAVKQRVYFTGNGAPFYGPVYKELNKVKLLDLIRFMEGKLTEDQLKKLATEE